MDLSLKGKVVLITGAGQGIGRGIAKIMADEGAKVAINDLDLIKAEKVAREIIQSKGMAFGVQADVTDLEQVKNMVSAITANLGPIDILINNAGVPVELRTGNQQRLNFAQADPSTWKSFVNLNLYGCLNCTYSVLSPMIEKKEGKIISIISEAGRIGEEYLSVYSSAKAAILGFSKALAREVSGFSINVNCIAIGATAHEATAPLLDPDATPEKDPILKKILKFYPMGQGLGRVGRPSDAAHAVAFLASPKACFITGQCLSVSGGFSMVS